MQHSKLTPSTKTHCSYGTSTHASGNIEVWSLGHLETFNFHHPKIHVIRNNAHSLDSNIFDNLVLLPKKLGSKGL